MLRIRSPGARRSYFVLSAAAALVAYGCFDSRMVADPARRIPGASGQFALMTSCGVSYTVTYIDDDYGLGQYGVPADTEVVNVCETWTGSDYQTQFTTVASNSGEFDAADASRIVTYNQGYVEAYDANGGYLSGAAVGNTAFDLVAATAAEIQASYDNPYYGVTGGGGGGGGNECPDPNNPNCEDEMMIVGASPAEIARSRPIPPGFRHNIRQKGWRFRLNDFEEDATAGNRRRFHRRQGELLETLEFDARTELLMAEERNSAREKYRADHTWKQTSPGEYVRATTRVEAEDRMPNGQVWRQRISMTISNFRRGNQ